MKPLNVSTAAKIKTTDAADCHMRALVPVIINIVTRQESLHYKNFFQSPGGLWGTGGATGRNRFLFAIPNTLLIAGCVRDGHSAGHPAQAARGMWDQSLSVRIQSSCRVPNLRYGFAFLQVTRFWAQSGGTPSLRMTQSRLITSLRRTPSPAIP